jgi:hypothetical protein
MTVPNASSPACGALPKIERAGARGRGRDFVVSRPHVIGEGVAGLVDMRLGRRKRLAHLLDHLRRRIGIGLAEMEQQRAFRLQVEIGRQPCAVEGDGAAQIEFGRRPHDHAAAPAEAEHRNAAAALHAIHRGADIEHHLVERQTVGEVPTPLGFGERHHRARRHAVVNAWKDRIVTIARIGPHHAFELVGQAENFLQYDQAALAGAFGRGVKGFEGMAIGRG